jgi:hypothetical protein
LIAFLSFVSKSSMQMSGTWLFFLFLWGPHYKMYSTVVNESTIGSLLPFMWYNFYLVIIILVIMRCSYRSSRTSNHNKQYRNLVTQFSIEHLHTIIILLMTSPPWYTDTSDLQHHTVLAPLSQEPDRLENSILCLT